MMITSRKSCFNMETVLFRGDNLIQLPVWPIFPEFAKKFFFFTCFSTEEYSFHVETRFPGCNHHSRIRYKFLHIVDCLYLCWPIAWLKHGLQIKVLELFSSFSRFLIKFPYYSSGFEIKVCHSNWLIQFIATCWCVFKEIRETDFLILDLGSRSPSL